MGTIVAHVQAARIGKIARAAGATPQQASGLDRLLSRPAAQQHLARIHHASKVVHDLREGLTAAVSSAYYVVGAVMLVGGVVALVILRHVPAADAAAEPPDTRVALSSTPPSA
jgi:hypothetical protein